MTRPAARLITITRAVIILVTLCLVSVGLAGPASATNGGTIFVRHGDKIQKAIDAASRGARIIVGPGTYAEQLTITKDGIDLIGLGAILTPPSDPVPVSNYCSGLAGPGTEAGICVSGANINLAEYKVEHRKFISVDRRVQGVSITGFQVRGFSGENIAVVGAQDARVVGNRLTDGARYGFLTVGSNNTRASANTVESSTALPYIGMCMDDLTSAEVSYNHIAGYEIALCVQTPSAEVHHNDVSSSCTGAFVDPGVVGAKLHDNRFRGTNPGCAEKVDPKTGLFFVFGIFVSGAVNTEVRRNRIEGQTGGGLANSFAVGLAVVDDESGAIASGNVVTQNVLRHNDFDLYIGATGTGNVVTDNRCTTSFFPDGLCG